MTMTNTNDQVTWPELLAPAGDPPTLKTAIGNGADAVYLGAGAFNARRNAVNFSPEELDEAISFAHQYSAKVYLTLNTLIADDEGEAALDLVARAYASGVDAVIIQDIGMAKALRRELPSLPLFASTQMSIADEAGLQAAARLGLRRVILPRELSLAEITRLTEQARSMNLETEVFVHGALCVCYSGQCLLSSLIGGRSGNRGECAQPCRLPWQLADPAGNKSVLSAANCLSPRDQALIEWIPALAQAGVASLKIEGRMRGSTYVAQVVAVYRAALDRLAADGSPSEESENRILRQAFNRGGGFTDRYISGQRNNDFLSGSSAGSFGVLLGTITAIEPSRGILRIMPAADWPADQLPGRGDVLSIRRPGADQETASAPIGEISRQGRILQVKGFHPDALLKLNESDPVYRMTDHQAEQLALQADRRRTAINFRLSGGPGQQDLVVLAASVQASPGPLAESSRTLTVSVSRPAGDVAPLLPERLDQQLRKVGNTPFRVADIQQDGTVCLTIAGINDLRRQVLDELAMKLGQSGRRDLPLSFTSSWRPAETVAAPVAPAAHLAGLAAGRVAGRVAAYYYQLPEDAGQIACGADIYYLPGLSLNAQNAPALPAMLHQVEPGCQVLVWLPAVMVGQSADLQKELLTGLVPWGFDGLCAGHPGLDLLAGEHKAQLMLVADSGANIYNQEALQYYAATGMAAFCPSLELSSDQRLAPLLQLADGLGVQMELMLYGRMRLMSSAFCPIGKNLPGCRRCHQQPLTPDQPDLARLFGLRDRKRLDFPLLPHPRACGCDLFSHFLLNAAAGLNDLLDTGPGQPATNPAALRARLCFLEETQAERQTLTSLARRMLDRQSPDTARAAAEQFQALTRQIAGRLGTAIRYQPRT